MSIEFIDLNMVKFDPAIVHLIPEPLARRYQAVCIENRDDILTVVMADPFDTFALDDLRIGTGFSLNPCLGDPEAIEAVLREFYGNGEEGEEGFYPAHELAEDEVIPDEPALEIVDHLFSQGIEKRASHIHLEPHEGEMLIRFRLDGRLHEIMRTSLEQGLAVISRIKMLANLNPSEILSAQTGKINMEINERNVGFYVSIFPIVLGESTGENLVIEIIETGKDILPVKELGFSDENLDKFIRLLEKPQGLILVTGPARSGKKTTLYSALQKINHPQIKIIAIDNSATYSLQGIIQTVPVIHNKKWFDFALPFRTALYQDPDVIMVEALRDQETILASIDAAYMGKMVLSSLSVQDAISGINFLLAMEVDPALLGITLQGMVNQRLVRKICENCKKEITPCPELLNICHKYGMKVENGVIFHGEGCSQCHQTGYRGRIGIFETLIISDLMKGLILHNAPYTSLVEQAKKDGMKPLIEEGLKKVLRGETTYQEIRRVLMPC